MPRAGRAGTALAAAAAALALLAGCGGEDGPLEEAEQAMARLDAGRLSLQLTAGSGGADPAGPVGFRLEGPFSFAGDGELAVLDLTYTRLLGGEEETTRVVSTGEALYVVAGEDVTEVPAGQAGALKLGDGESGVADLGIAGWALDPAVERRDDGTRVVSGKADVADVLSDLARIGSEVGAGTAGEALEGEAADRLRRLGRGDVTVEIAPDDLPRSVRAVLDFGREVPAEVAEALGPYAAARLELSVALERLTEELRVEPPAAGG